MYGSENSSRLMAEINVTPLVDVMLVLLIIFMMTAPMMTHTIKIDLPQPNPNVQQPEHPLAPISLKIDATGALYWNGIAVDELGMKAQMAVLAQQARQPEIQISATDDVAYEAVARVLADAASYGLTKIGFTDIDSSKQ